MPNTEADLAALLRQAERLFDRAGNFFDRLDRLVPAPAAAPDWAAHQAFRWRRQRDAGRIEAIAVPQNVILDRLAGIEAQKQEVVRNTEQFINGLPANNLLLTGARGTGKSSLVKAMLPLFSKRGLRMIEVDKSQLADLADITARLAGQPWRFIIFCDDLSFEQDDAGYMALKVALDGSLSATPDNVLIYATSNRRHLMPEFMQDNLASTAQGTEIHPGETVEEKTALSDRFGLWLSFWPFDQDTYLTCVRRWLDALDTPVQSEETLRHEALQWALARGTRSGRSAWQFARDFSGRQQLAKMDGPPG